MLKVKLVLKVKPVLKREQDSDWRAGHAWVMVGTRKGGAPLGRDAWGEADWSSGLSAEAAEPVPGVPCACQCAAF